MDEVKKALNAVKSQLSRKYVAILDFKSSEPDMYRDDFFDVCEVGRVINALKNDGYNVEKRTDRYENITLYVTA